MPVTGWEEVAGKPCQMCGGPATHFYGDVVICCDCHVGEVGGGLFSRDQAEEEHKRVLAAKHRKKG